MTLDTYTTLFDQAGPADKAIAAMEAEFNRAMGRLSSLGQATPTSLAAELR